MQNLNSGQEEKVSAQEAQAVLKAWADQQQAQGVDPGVNSVTSLAAGLGVSEQEVRKMLEDIRVHQRSQQIAAGILQQEQTHRKRLDITAAIGAGAALIVIALVIVGIVVFGHRASSQRVLTPETPGIPAGLPGAHDVFRIDGDHMVIKDKDGTETIMDENGIHVTKPDGSSVQINDPSGMAAMAAKLSSLKGLEKEGKLSPQEKKQVADLSKWEAALKQGSKEKAEAQNQSPIPPVAPKAETPNGR